MLNSAKGVEAGFGNLRAINTGVIMKDTET